MRIRTLALAAAGVIGAAVVIGPLLIPLRPLTDTVSPEQLADPDSRFLEVEGVRLHYKQAGIGEPTIFLLHGFAASTFSWREVMAPLAEAGRVVAYDRPSSGLTERPLAGQWTGPSPYGPQAQVEQLIGLMDRIGADRSILVGHSAGGAVALHAALLHPERVRALILVAPAVYVGGGLPAWSRPLLGTPQMERLGPLLARRLEREGFRLLEMAWHDPSRIGSDVRAGYAKPLRARDWDRGLWELAKAGTPAGLAERAGELRMPVLVIAGDDDRVVPTTDSVRLAEAVPHAELVRLSKCGHLPQEECPAAFLEAVRSFLEQPER